MLKTRVIPTLLYRDFNLVKGVQFDTRRQIGNALQAIKVYNMREVDELVFLDVSATNQQRAPDLALIDDLADDCFMPFTVGGGVSSVDQVGQLLRVGADKVILNTAAVERPDLINEAADRFGSQCIVVSIDYRTVDGTHIVYTHSGSVRTQLEPVAWATVACDRGAGEILITSIDRDGTLTGYDLDMIRTVSAAVDVPVIASGGASGYDDFVLAMQAGASAVAAGAMFHFTQCTPLEGKRRLAEAGFPVRIT